MNILVATFNTPGYALGPLTAHLRRRGHTVHEVVLKNRYTRRFVPLLSHALNVRDLWRSITGEHREEQFDLGIAADPTLAATLLHARDRGRVKQVIYWRIDYYPRKYGPLTFAYRRLDEQVQECDQVWGITALDDRATHYVPYLLDPGCVVDDPGKRGSRAIFAGPSLDRSYSLCAEAVADCLPNVDLVSPNYADKDKTIDEQGFHRMLLTSKVGLAPYEPFPNTLKRYADPARVKHYLGAGLPVVTTNVAPIWEELAQSGAGRIVVFEKVAVADGIRHCLQNFDEMSNAAYELAGKYTISDLWIPIPVEERAS